MSAGDHGVDFDQWSRDEFFRLAIQPEFANTMKFVLDIPEEKRNPEAAFSIEGFDTLVENIQSFLMARTLGTWTGTGAPPHELTVTVNLEFKADSKRSLNDGVFPWWVLADDGKNMIDGGMRRLAEKLSDERR
jgi:hypothetical protein